MRLHQTILCIITVGTVVTFAEKKQPSADSTTKQALIIPSNPELSHRAFIYHKTLTEPLFSFKQANYEYLKAMTKIRKAKRIENKRQQLLQVLSALKDHVQKSEIFNNDDTFTSELNRYLEMSYIVLKQDFDKILDMEDIEAQSYDQEEAHQLAIDMAVEKLNNSFIILRTAEKNFFTKYEINSTETKDDLSEKIEKANSAIDYYNSISRIFLKVNKEDNYARKAVGEKDVAALEQHTATLVSFANEGLAALEKITGYNGDRELLQSVTQLVTFYKNEGLITYPANVDHYLKTDQFQQAIKTFKAIKESDRKQTDVDTYNKAVDTYNKSVKEFNNINTASFKQQKKIVKLWNQQVEKFFNKHS